MREGTYPRRMTRLVAVAVLVLVTSLSAPVSAGEGPTCRGRAATIVGTAENDVIVGTSADDVIVAGDGGDLVKARGGDDVVCGDDGPDRLDGGPGDDVLDGGAWQLHANCAKYRSAPHGVRVDLTTGQARRHGHDRLFSITCVLGSPHDDLLRVPMHGSADGRRGTDIVAMEGDAGDELGGSLGGGAGNDEVLADSDGSASLYGGPGRDAILGSRLPDTILAGPGDDVVRGRAEGDAINGGTGDDNLHGGRARDVIQGGYGADRLWGRHGDDWLGGGPGFDHADGGAGDSDRCGNAEGVTRCERVPEE